MDRMTLKTKALRFFETLESLIKLHNGKSNPEGVSSKTGNL